MPFRPKVRDEGPGWRSTHASMEPRNAPTALTRRRRYRRFFIMSAILGGMVVGVGVGSFAALAGQWWVLLILFIPFGARLYGRIAGRVWSVDPAVWLYPVVALPVAAATYLLVPAE